MIFYDSDKANWYIPNALLNTPNGFVSNFSALWDFFTKFFFQNQLKYPHLRCINILSYYSYKRFFWLEKFWVIFHVSITYVISFADLGETANRMGKATLEKIAWTSGR